ncbi:MAG: hypothetical protein KC502_23600, partial [Myxococcales bacterium]|nr:hypothetical protein [Myxococcales bacterium]
MIRFSRVIRPLAGVFLCASLLFVTGCGDEFPNESSEDVSSAGDISNDLGTIDSTDPGDGESGDATNDVVTDGVATDDGGAGDGTGNDGGGDCPGAAGCECKADADCTAGACVLDGDGSKTCAAPCEKDADCDSDQVCQDVSGSKVCVERGAALCAPCVSNSACSYGDSAGACVAGGAAGNFCGTSCKATADCDKGYTCSDVKDVDGADTKQCVPDAGATCECSGWAIATSAKTTCFAAGLPGCTNTRQCLADGADGAPTGGGLGACTTKAPEKETCDGIDNNCDGTTDEDGAKGCDDSNPCTTDTCDGGKGCVNKKLDGGACDDGNACTKGDTCAVGLCTGATVSCDDSNPCTDDSCDMAAGCTTTNNTKSCDDGSACTKDDTCAAALCSGVTITCDDSNPCTDDSCDLSTGCTTTNNSSKCDDGDACTKDDGCAASLCSGATVDCDDNNPCTKDACDAKTGCTNAKLDSGACDDGSACTKDDKCTAGKCDGDKVECDDKNP